MNKILKLSWILLLSIFFGNTAQTQTPPERVNVNPKPVEQKIDFECPRDVRIGFKNPPSGWQEGLGGGVGASVPFAEAVVLGFPQVLTCIYRQEEGNVMFFTLVQQAPNGYKCAVEKMSDKEKYNRFITCTLNTAPVILPKQN